MQRKSARADLAAIALMHWLRFPPLLATIAPQKRNLQPYFYYLQVPLSSVFATMAPAILGRNRAFVRCAAEKGGNWAAARHAPLRPSALIRMAILTVKW